MARSASTWAKDDQPFFAGPTGVRRLQGPNSHLAKFGKTLCHPCNTTRSQPWDRAYEVFSAWAHSKGANLLAESDIDFVAIYGADCESGTLHLLRYFAKLLGCRIVDSGNPVPAGLRLALTSNNTLPFAMSFAANGSSIGGLPIRGGGILGNFPLLGTLHAGTGAVDRYISGSMVGHLDAIYRYDLAEVYPWEGEAISSPSRQVRLGRYAPSSGQPHVADGMLPGPRQQFRIGAIDVEVFPLSRESWLRVSSLAAGMAGASIEENLTARVAIVLEIFAGRYPEITAEYLGEHLTIPLCDAIFTAVGMTRSDQAAGTPT